MNFALKLLIPHPRKIKRQIVFASTDDFLELLLGY